MRKIVTSRVPGDRMVRASPEMDCTPGMHSVARPECTAFRVLCGLRLPAGRVEGAFLPPKRMFAPVVCDHDATGVGERPDRGVRMRGDECGVLPVATGARGVSPKTRPAGGPGGCGATAGTRVRSKKCDCW